MATEWVDFKNVKEGVDMQMVLDHYGIKGLTKNGDELRGPCPIHRGSPRSKNFTVNTRKNAFNCFSLDCKARGNVLDFVAAMEHCDVRGAALKIAEWFKIGESEPSSRAKVESTGADVEVTRGIYSDHEGHLFEVITTALNEDLDSLVVCRELFGDYRFHVSSMQNFGDADSEFTLVKAL
jgi:hypothetical protein